MSKSDAEAPANDPKAAQLAETRGLVRTATARLLGDTISVADDAWRAPSRLPGWSRGHVATHVARHADALLRLTEWARTGEQQAMYASGAQRDEDIEAGSGRRGVELQVDLDTTAERLEEAFTSLDDAPPWDVRVELRGGLQVPARMLPLARLTEVVIHHVDLDVGFEVDDIDEITAAWLLEWSAFRLRNRDEFPRLELTSSSGLRIAVGSSGRPIAVRGTNAQLLGWLTSRSRGSSVTGAADLVLPSF
jgi:maleylpyruvate isomerase